MISEILRKWFGLEPTHCEVCEVLRLQLDESNRERKELLQRVLTPPTTAEPLPPSTEELKPITPQFIPWNVRRQMLEAEDRKRAQLLKSKSQEIEKLENELGVNNGTVG